MTGDILLLRLPESVALLLVVITQPGVTSLELDHLRVLRAMFR
jgi:hypothetical protein